MKSEVHNVAGEAVQDSAPATSALGSQLLACVLSGTRLKELPRCGVVSLLVGLSTIHYAGLNGNG